MLRITASVQNHKHGVYLGPRGQGLTSEENGHVHPVEFDDESQNWFILPAGDDPHVHELEAVEQKAPREERKTDKERIDEVIALFKEADQNEGDSIDNGLESWDFYMGDQWDPGLKSQLERNQRAAITVNEIQGKIDLLRGSHSQNKVDPIFKPVEDSDENTADIANFLWKSIMQQNNFHKEEDYVFHDLTVTGRGIKDVFVDFDTNPEGDIKIRWFPWNKVRFGPHMRQDQEDMEYLVKIDKFSKGKLKQLFPDKAKEIELSFRDSEVIESSRRTRQPHQNIAGQAYRLDQNRTTALINGEPVVDIQRKEFRVFEAWQKEFKTIDALIFPIDAFVESSEGMNKKDLALLKRIPGMRTITQNRHKIRVTKIAGNIMLSTKLQELPENANDFHLMTSYAKKYNNRFHGKVEDVKGVQQEINKRHSQIIDIMNRMASYGWFFDDDTFWDQGEAEEFKRISSKAGFVQRVKDASRPPTKVEGARFPTELVGLEQISSEKLNLLMGIVPDLGPNASGKAILFKRRESLMGNDFLFENLNMANRRLAKMVMAHVQDLYSAQRIMRIIGSASQEDLANAQNPNVINVTIDDIQAMLDNKDLTKLDIVMSETTHTDTMKDLSFLSLLELMQAVGPNQTLLKHIIKNSPFPNKNVILKEMGIQNQQEADVQDKTHASEEFKSQPDEVKLALSNQGILTSQDLAQSRQQGQQGQEQGAA